MSVASVTRETARTFGFGRALLHLYHQPVGRIRKSIAEGGPFEQRRTERGRQEMIGAAKAMPSIVAPSHDIGARVAFLSGAEFWYQTLFCYASLQRWSPFKITPVIFDDGTLNGETRSFMQRVAPWAEFVEYNEIESQLDEKLPEGSFPYLRRRRLEYPHLRKLTDIHTRGAGWTLVLDSDVLFFRKPAAVLDWFASPKAIYMQDVQPMYGYPDELMRNLSRGPLPKQVNVGLYALYSPNIDWDRLEYCCRKQLELYGTHYLQEQALTALVLAEADPVPLAEEDYVVLPSLDEGRNPKAVLHHYVANSKRSYFQCGWRHVSSRFAG